uniref:Ig-like domain-containing protein n=1 Tax=Scleropages formosus TaxID=113540 RepID=A0A8C9WBW5_SCLFO
MAGQPHTVSHPFTHCRQNHLFFLNCLSLDWRRKPENQAVICVDPCFSLCLTASGVKCAGLELDQSPPQVKRPGESVKLSCVISGFQETRYNMHWIRQKAGAGLEWIGVVYSGSTYDPDYAASLKGQFTLTEDVSKSTQYLEAKSLKAEDTAVYYCARDSH